MTTDDFIAQGILLIKSYIYPMELADWIREACDRLKQAEARIAELEARARWQTMESAPRDGTNILARLENGNYAVVGWYPSYNQSTNPATEIWGWQTGNGIESDYSWLSAEPVRWVSLKEEPLQQDVLYGQPIDYWWC